MANIITPRGFAVDISDGYSTVDNAETVLIAATGPCVIGFYKERAASIISKEGATYEHSYEPIASLPLTAGTHLIKKAASTFLSADATKSPVLATSVAVFPS